MTRTDLSERSRAYARMAEALSFLGDTWEARPDLAACARAVGLSPAHFQREFSRWAGLSPKQYQAAFAHAAAGEAMREGASVIEAAFEAGLSGPSRLHDLFIAHEGLTPGEAKSGGDGLEMRMGTAPTPFGTGVFLIAPKGLASLAFADYGATRKTGFEHPGYGLDDTIAQLKARYPAASFISDDKAAEDMARRIFQSGEPVPVALYGTPFRRQVWRALLEIAPSSTCTYGELASAIGNPNAARAVGTAVGANPIAWCIPCHRALASDGRLHNYHWGVARKRAMLSYEAARAAS
jgi:AraC family transcriptional regulator of adaptative response/methylated-DNA-[protein]-cysteine methyltransferase